VKGEVENVHESFYCVCGLAVTHMTQSAITIYTTYYIFFGEGVVSILVTITLVLLGEL